MTSQGEAGNEMFKLMLFHRSRTSFLRGDHLIEIDLGDVLRVHVVSELLVEEVAD